MPANHANIGNPQGGSPMLSRLRACYHVPINGARNACHAPLTGTCNFDARPAFMCRLVGRDMHFTPQYRALENQTYISLLSETHKVGRQC